METLRKIVAALHLGNGVITFITGPVLFFFVTDLWFNGVSTPWWAWTIPVAVMVSGALITWFGFAMWEMRRWAYITVAIIQTIVATVHVFFSPYPAIVMLSLSLAAFYWVIVPSRFKDDAMDATATAVASIARACIGR